MDWDLGVGGLALLVGMSFGFGLIAQVVAGRGRHRLWSIAVAAYFIGGLVASEVWFGWATEEELQPNIDGLSFDEALLSGLVFGIVAVVIVRRITRRHRLQRPRAVHS